MWSTKNIVCNKAGSKRLLITVLLLSLFSFSVNTVYQSQRQVTKTELAASFRHAPERANYFKTISSTTWHKSIFALSSIDIKAALLQFAQMEKVWFDNNVIQVLCFKSVTKFYRQFHTPYYTDGDSLIFPRG